MSERSERSEQHGVPPQAAGHARTAEGGRIVTVAITGVGLHPFGRHDGVSLTAMGAAAARAALAEAGVLPGQRDALGSAFVGTAYGGVAAGHKVLGALALTGIPIVDVEAGCASGAAALALGAAAVRSGEHQRVLVLGIEKMPKGMIRSSFFEPWQEAAGLTPAPAYFALRAQRLLRERGLTKEHLAALVVKNRAAGVTNPDAMFRKAVTAEEVLASRIVSEPLHLWMLCSPNEGAAAVVLEAGDGDGVTLRAACLRSHLPGSVLAESSPLAGIDDTGIPAPSQLAAADAYEIADCGPADLDAVECQDTDAARELLAWEELGLCEPGEQAAALADGRFDNGGRCAVNASGGLLSKGEPLGASALGQVVFLIRRLQAGDARLALAHTVGRGANASVVILSG